MHHCSSTWRRYHGDLIAHLSGEYQNNQSIVFQVFGLERLPRSTIMRLTAVTIEVRCRCWPPVHFSVHTLKCFFFTFFFFCLLFLTKTSFRTKKELISNFLAFATVCQHLVNGGVLDEKESNLFLFSSLTCSERWGSCVCNFTRNGIWPPVYVHQLSFWSHKFNHSGQSSEQ